MRLYQIIAWVECARLANPTSFRVLGPPGDRDIARAPDNESLRYHLGLIVLVRRRYALVS